LSTDILKALVLGVVEGLTEFLPISSTGHLIIAEQLLGMDDERAKVFAIVIQTGAILAVCWEYRARLVAIVAGLASEASARRFTANVAVAFMPLALLGILFGDWIKEHLFNPFTVAAAFIVGGVLILWAERREHRATVESVEGMTLRDAMGVGVAQAFALIPGTSRAGATIIGGLFLGLSRRAATEFSFFLAIPTLLAASALELVSHRDLLGAADVGVFATGFLAAFVSAFIAVRALLRYIARHDFTAFAWYRIAFGVLVFATGYAGLIEWSGK